MYAHDIISLVTARLGRDISDVKASLEISLNNAINEICSFYSFDFLRMFPGAISAPVPDTFDTAPYWYDKGWLVVQEDVTEYPFVYYDSTSPINAFIRELRQVSYYDFEGDLVGHLETFTPQVFFRQASLMDEGSPLYATYDHRADASYLKISPIPQEKYLLQVYYVLKSFPYVTESNTNYILMNHSNVVINYMLREAYRDIGEIERSELHGRDYKDGLLAMKKESKIRELQGIQAFPVHTGANEWKRKVTRDIDEYI